MAAITLIEADSATQSGKADLIFADPPFDLPGDVLAKFYSATIHRILF